MTSGGVIILHQPIVERGSIINLQPRNKTQKGRRPRAISLFLIFMAVWGLFLYGPLWLYSCFLFLFHQFQKEIKETRNSSGTNVSLQNSQIVCLTLFHIFIYFYGSDEI
jgi:hypothetical protein